MFFEELGVISKSRHGYVYPISDQASTILDVLCYEVNKLNINVILEETVENITKDSKVFLVKSNKNSGKYQKHY